MKQNRIYAFLIDLLIVAVPFVSIMLVGVFMLKTAYRTAFVPSVGVAALLLLLRDLPGGRSPGKYFIGLKISGARSKWALLLRNVPLILLPLEALLYLTGQRRLGDTLAGTAVIEDEKADFRQGTVLLAGIFIAGLFVYMSVTNLVGSYIWQKQEYLITEAFIHGSKEIQEKTGGVVNLSKLPKYSLSRKHGQVNVKIETKVYGNKQNADLIIRLSKKEGEQWVVQGYEYADEE